jgi:hypothetical protein
VSALARGLLVIALLSASATAACGNPISAPAPRACALLTDADIERAAGAAPATSGGAEANGQSTCSWALGGDAGGSVTVTLLDCTTADCASKFDVAAPPPGWVSAPGHGGDWRITLAGGQSEMAVRAAHEILTVGVDLSGRDAGSALTSLTQLALSRLP